VLANKENENNVQEGEVEKEKDTKREN